MEKNTLGLLMTSFIAILLGVVLIQPVADNVTDVSTASANVLNESVALSSGGSNTTATLRNIDLYSFTALRNTSGATVTGECNITLSTAVLLCNGTEGSGTPLTSTCYADYDYKPPNYVESIAAATMIRLVIIFFAIGVILIAIGYGLKMLKDNNFF